MQWLEVDPGSDTDVSITKRVGDFEEKKAKQGGFRSLFKPVGGSYSAGLSGQSVKKLKKEDGTAAVLSSTMGIEDVSIVKNDTVLCPVSQFAFTEADIKNRYGGDASFLLTGIVTNVTESTINIKFEGDTHVSPYPIEGKTHIYIYI